MSGLAVERERSLPTFEICFSALGCQPSEILSASEGQPSEVFSASGCQPSEVFSASECQPSEVFSVSVCQLSKVSTYTRDLLLSLGVPADGG